MSGDTDLVSIIRQFGGDPADLPFWEACREGRFLLHQCSLCRRHYWPASRCIEHGDRAMEWIDSEGAGTLHTYTVLHHAYTPGMKDKVPYAVGVIRLAEGPFFHSNIIECVWQDVAIGMALRATMIEHETGLTLPVFRPDAADRSFF